MSCWVVPHDLILTDRRCREARVRVTFRNNNKRKLLGPDR